MSGVFGAITKGECAETVFYGTDYHSHLGTEYGGMATLGENFDRHIHSISQAQFKSKFFDDAQRMKGNKGIGVISDCDEQPIYLYSKFGPFCIVTVGLIENKKQLAQNLFDKGHSFSEVSKNVVNVPELIAKLISQGETLIDGIERMFEIIDGSCSLLLLHHDGIYAARDRLGYTPLVIGRRGEEWAVSSESSAMPNLGFEPYKALGPGEIVLMTEAGLLDKKKAGPTNQICSFLWIYTGFPASNYEGINVETVREKCGQCLARKDKGEAYDLVSGVPDSGVAHAIGYAIESRIPYRRPLVKYTPGYGRSYTPPTQSTRDFIAKMKLIPVNEIIQGNRIVVCEDSIVRGTQLKNFTVNKLWDAGAKEVHVRPACPPLMFPCRFCLSTRSIHELAARKAIKVLEGRDIEDISPYLDPTSEKYRQMVDWIKKDLEVTSLKYQTIDDMIAAIGLPRERLCLYCWTGNYPQDKNPLRKTCSWDDRGKSKKKEDSQGFFARIGSRLFKAKNR